jgi:2-polyprenylphenol hydroxylase and related flavodoxin oxidoreductases
MPTPILHKESLIPGKTSKLVLHAPQIAQKARPGHFVMLRMSEQGERIPLTIADTDRENGTITIVYLVMGKSTAMLEALGVGDAILDVCGPLGHPTHIENAARSYAWAAAPVLPPCTTLPRAMHASATRSWALSALAAKTCCSLKTSSNPLWMNCLFPRTMAVTATRALLPSFCATGLKKQGRV